PVFPLPAREPRLPHRGRSPGRGCARATGPARASPCLPVQGVLVARRHGEGAGATGGDVPARPLPVDGLGSGTLARGRGWRSSTGPGGASPHGGAVASRHAAFASGNAVGPAAVRARDRRPSR